ncbi:MAG: Two-component sensor histidine kinase [Caloramator sp.]|jgi:two-component system sensor histidine kinase DegS|uniref:sensor histidine kinase n=1 Tax=Caloramator sp. TaxID=1871330 RepID=UPI001D771437|nr:sensor histidine kinase [Caloramator sp.]MBZ4664204.1 Two-component sensor histidine kinase [Caloramator sp.]
MKRRGTEISEINEIIKRIIEQISNSKEMIINIIDNVKKEEAELIIEIKQLKDKIAEIIEEVDELEKLDKKMRQSLSEVSSRFDKYTEKDIKEVYDKAYEVRLKLLTKRNEEKSLRDKRDRLEIQLKKLGENINNAQKAISQITVALKYLEGEALSTLNLDDKESEMLVGIKILEAQEDERKRIARDIHDGPAQYVASAVMRIDFAKKVIEKDLDKGMMELSELKEVLKTALKEIRAIIFDLRPMSLDDLGLAHTIQEYVKSIKEEKDIKIELKIKPIDDEIEPIIQVAVYRIIQEILNNVKKHSKAKNVEVKLDYGLKYLMIVVSDDGVGFDVEETLKKVKTQGTNYGLLGIIERVNQLQGEFELESKKGVGTKFKIKLPVNRGGN